MSETSKSSADSPNDTGQYVVVARRYRPQTFDELIGQEHVTRALKQAIASDRVGHAYLFTGSRGTGKTSAARILAKALNCVEGPTPTPCNKCDVCQCIATGDDVDVLEIDGASNRGIDEIRQLRQNAAIRPSRVRYKIYIIDEVHMLTKEAFNALLKTLEEPPEHVKFIMATTEPNKIPITILSRCQRFDFAGVDSKSIQTRLAQIAQAEGAEIDQEALQILASRAAGSMRDSQSLLEQLLSVAGGKITAQEVNQLLGIAPTERLNQLVRHLADRQGAGALAEVDAMVTGGVEPGQLVDQLLGFYRDVMAMTVGCDESLLLYTLPSQRNNTADVAKQLGLPNVLAAIQILDQTAARMRVSVHDRTLLEMAVVRICSLEDLEDIASLVEELRSGTSPEVRQAGPAPRRTPDPVSRPNTEVGRVPSLPSAPTAPRGEATAATVVRESPQAPSSEDQPREVVANFGEGNVAELWNLAAADVGGLVGSNAALADPVTLISSDTISASFTDKWYKELCEQPENRQRIEAALSRIAGRPVRVNYVVASAEAAGDSNSPPPVRASRRQQMTDVAQRPFVQKAMELFDVAPGQFGYMPPEG